MRVFAGLLGVVLLVGTMVNVVRTLVLPRAMASRLLTTLWRFWRAVLRGVARPRYRYEPLDRLLEWLAPLILVSQLLVWLLTLFAGFGLLIYSAAPGIGWSVALREAGSSLFTLGFAVPHRPELTTIDFVAAASGPLMIALQIAYLPTLYATYNRRETEVTLLRSLAGEPSWGPELLARQCLVGTVDNLRRVYLGWERLAADIGESHANYPILMAFRSPKPYRSWIIAMLAVMDAAAIHLTLAPGTAPSETRLVLRAGFLALRDIADARGIPYDPDPRPDAPIALTLEDFRQGVTWATACGFRPEREVDDAWSDFKGWRVNYESLAYALARRHDAVPALWSGPRDWPADPVPPMRPPHRQPGAPEVRFFPGLAAKQRGRET
ncbi:hypothetical protein [Planosporangium mesophilum]|uniref:Two pore domain potassium channel family protein n=1 Tax=Planosporangium mesophilum TaxID=689768 RepID=A0A8J3TBD7_9ACTN|nr:hypothetical protein [Planosporangium mesophilum]NJC83399.1 hypothetical protein [Planosporangium mesophilum]GII21779.1 hypothetical protein Pme01_13760 [Planosporangium mesophilum]